MSASIGYFGGIVTNGLVLYMDAGKPDSYPGYGTAWRSVARGSDISGSLVNGVGFTYASGSTMIFDGSNDYVSNFSKQISGTESKTIEVWFNASTTNRGGLCGTRSTLITGTGWVFTINRTSAGNLTYYHTGGTTLEVAAGISANTWYKACVTYNSATTTATLYLNGSVVGSPNTTFSGITASSFNGVIGDEEQSFTTLFAGKIANVSIYNRALSSTEILQNYNATKARFGLT